jgi:N6-L-threonylcarbamoyladenine synthase
MYILGIESSCDETSAAVMHDGKILSNIISSQFVHRQYGGVVPELASRAHQRLIVPVVNEALEVAGVSKNELGGVAVTYGPGLIGALLVGVNFAKAMAYGLDIPLIGVNHLEAHMYSNFIDDPKPEYPLLCLLVSGGHTQLVLIRSPFEHEMLGETLDDAAGEAFDKVAKMLGLGFPGGPQIDKLAKEGNPKFIRFPRSLLDEGSFDFSFSGIKTSMLYWLRDHKLATKGERSQPIDPAVVADLCASFQAAIVDVLVAKIIAAVHKFRVRDVAIAGGVSANSELQRRLLDSQGKHGFRLFMPQFNYCTDNAAMIAQVGSMKLNRGISSTMELNAVANVSL